MTSRRKSAKGSQAGAIEATAFPGAAVLILGIGAAKALEATLREALAVLQSRCNEQGARLNAARKAEEVVRKAQLLLEQRVVQLTTERHSGGENWPQARNSNP